MLQIFLVSCRIGTSTHICMVMSLKCVAPAARPKSVLFFSRQCVSVLQWRCSLDEVKLAAAQCCQYRSAVMHSTSAATVTSWAVVHWLRRGEASRCIWDLTIFIDAGVTVTTHISKTVADSLAALWQMRSIQRLISGPVLLYLVMLFVPSHLGYGIGLWVQVLGELPNTCRIVCSRFLMQQHVSFAELANMTTCLHCLGTTLSLCSWLHQVPTPECLARDLQWTADTDFHQHLRACRPVGNKLFWGLDFTLSVIVLLMPLLLVRGTVCCLLWSPLQLSVVSRNIFRPIYFTVPSLYQDS